MKSGILLLVALTLALFSSSVLALPGRHLNGKHKIDIPKLRHLTGVHPQGFDELFSEYYYSFRDAFNVIILFAEPEVEKLLDNYRNVKEQVQLIYYAAHDEMGAYFEETYYSLNPDDALEDTALLIDVSVVRLTLLLTKAGKAIEDVVAKDAVELLPALKSIHKQVAGDVEWKLEPLMALVREVLPLPFELK